MNDTRNPYTPPKAEVAAAGLEAGEGVPEIRPAAVNIALFLIGVEIILSLIGVVNDVAPVSAGEKPALTLVINLFDVATLTLLCVFISHGRNWARIAFLVLWLISLFFAGVWIYTSLFVLPESIGYQPDWESIGWMMLPHLLALTSVALLFGPGRGWFLRRVTISQAGKSSIAS